MGGGGGTFHVSHMFLIFRFVPHAMLFIINIIIYSTSVLKFLSLAFAMKQVEFMCGKNVAHGVDMDFLRGTCLLNLMFIRTEASYMNERALAREPHHR